MPSVIGFLSRFVFGSLGITPCTRHTLLPEADSLDLIANLSQYNMAFGGMVRGLFGLIIPT